MQSKVLSRRNLLIGIVVIGLAFSPALLYHFIPESLIQNESTKPAKNINAFDVQEKKNVQSPVRLKIPKIGVDADIESVGLTADGSMDAPKAPANVAWFNLGQRPGEKGTAVMAGHYGRRKDGRLSVFDNLYELRKGDKVYVEDERGTTISFVVRETRRYDPSADASSVFGSGDGKAHLNLITCEGVWDEASKTYSKRLVVFTDKE